MASAKSEASHPVWLRTLDAVYSVFEDPQIKSQHPHLAARIQDAVELTEQVLKELGPDKMSLSFNGGKDCEHVSSIAQLDKLGTQHPSSSSSRHCDCAHSSCRSTEATLNLTRTDTADKVGVHHLPFSLFRSRAIHTIISSAIQPPNTQRVRGHEGRAGRIPFWWRRDVFSRSSELVESTGRSQHSSQRGHRHK